MKARSAVYANYYLYLSLFYLGVLYPIMVYPMEIKEKEAEKPVLTAGEYKKQEAASAQTTDDQIWQVPKLSKPELAVAAGIGVALVSAGAALMKLGQWGWSRIVASPSPSEQATINAAVSASGFATPGMMPSAEQSDLEEEVKIADKNKPFWEVLHQDFTREYDRFLARMMENQSFKEMYRGTPGAEENPFVLHVQTDWKDLLDGDTKTQWGRILAKFSAFYLFVRLSGILKLNQFDLLERAKDNWELIFSKESKSLFTKDQRIQIRELAEEIVTYTEMQEQYMQSPYASGELPVPDSTQFTNELMERLQQLQIEEDELDSKQPVSSSEVKPVVAEASDEEEDELGSKQPVSSSEVKPVIPEASGSNSQSATPPLDEMHFVD